jgi:drug/metabolite transporter (DMT)-like permease
MVSYLLLLFVGVIWGSTFIVIKDALQFLQPFAILTIRFFIAAVVLYIIIGLKKLKISRDLGFGILSGVIQFITFVPQVIGLRYTTPSNSAFITGLYIIFVPFAHILLQKTKPKKIEVVACVVAVIGLWVLTGGVTNMNFGDWITLITAIAIAFYLTVTSIAIKKGANPFILTFHQMWVGAVLGGIGSLLFHETLYTQNYPVYLAIVYLGVFASAIAVLIQNSMLSRVNVIVASILLSTEPLFALLFSWILQYEPMNGMKLAGGVIIFVAIILPDAFGKVRFSKS